jgi:hypothetical protein
MYTSKSKIHLKEKGHDFNYDKFKPRIKYSVFLLINNIYKN